MTTHTITTTARIVTLTVGNGSTLRLPAELAGVDVAGAIDNALSYVTPLEIHQEFLAHLDDAEKVGATNAQIRHHFVAWLNGFGDWAE
jgi:hypothetical protein